jgi:hypothetical protein
MQRLVLSNLAFRADEQTLTCYPSAARVARDTGMSRRGVQKVTEALANRGLIAVVSSGAGKGRNAPNKYRLIFLEMVNPVRYSHGQKWRTAEQGMTNGVTVNGEPGSHEPLNHKRTVQSAAALALEARAPRRSRTPETGESPEARRRRQLLGVADLFQLPQEPSEPEHRFLKRVMQRKAEWDREQGVV